MLEHILITIHPLGKSYIRHCLIEDHSTLQKIVMEILGDVENSLSDIKIKVEVKEHLKNHFLINGRMYNNTFCELIGEIKVIEDFDQEFFNYDLESLKGNFVSILTDPFLTKSFN